MAERSLKALVIATASGAPMRSERPKPIHMLCGRPMLTHVLEVLGAAGVESAVVVTGPRGDWINKRIMEDPPSIPVSFVEQQANRGGADAALVGLTGFDEFDDDGDVLVLPADLPLLDLETLAGLVYDHRKHGAACTVLSASASGSELWPRIDRDARGSIIGMTHAADAPPTDENVEVGLGIYCIRRELLAPAARRSAPSFGAGLHHLSTVPTVLAESGHAVSVSTMDGDLGNARPVDDRFVLLKPRPNCGAGPTAVGLIAASRWLTPIAPTSMSRSRSAPMSRSSRGRCSRGRPQSATDAKSAQTLGSTAVSLARTA